MVDRRGLPAQLRSRCQIWDGVLEFGAVVTTKPTVWNINLLHFLLSVAPKRGGGVRKASILYELRSAYPRVTKSKNTFFRFIIMCQEITMSFDSIVKDLWLAHWHETTLVFVRPTRQQAFPERAGRRPYQLHTEFLR